MTVRIKGLSKTSRRRRTNEDLTWTVNAVITESFVRSRSCPPCWLAMVMNGWWWWWSVRSRTRSYISRGCRRRKAVKEGRLNLNCDDVDLIWITTLRIRAVVCSANKNNRRRRLIDWLTVNTLRAKCAVLPPPGRNERATVELIWIVCFGFGSGGCLLRSWKKKWKDIMPEMRDFI